MFMVSFDAALKPDRKGDAYGEKLNEETDEDDESGNPGREAVIRLHRQNEALHVSVRGSLLPRTAGPDVVRP